MNNVENTFNNAEKYNGDSYVADYTQKTGSKKKVVISKSAPSDIDYFQLKNPNNIIYWGVNFEQHKGFFASGVHDCECMFVSDNAKHKPWLLLLELKYCQDKNIDGNVQTAYCQLNDTFNLLKTKGLADEKNHTIYLNIGIPEHGSFAPFTSSILSQEEILNYRKKGINYMGYNCILILDKALLKVPKVKV